MKNHATNVEQLFKSVGEPVTLRADIAMEFFSAVLALAGAGYSVDIQKCASASLRGRVVRRQKIGGCSNARVADLFAIDPTDETPDLRRGVGYAHAGEFPNDYAHDELFMAVIGEVVKEN